MKKILFVAGVVIIGVASCLLIDTPKADPPKPLSTNLTVSVIKPPIDTAVVQFSVNGYTVTLRLVAVAGADTVIDKLFSEKYKQGASLPVLQAKFIDEMQAELDAFQARHTIYNAAAFNNSVTAIQNGLDGIP